MRKIATALLMCLALIALTNGIRGQRKSSDKLFPIVQDGKWGFIDKTGRVVIEPQFAFAHEFSDGLAAIGILRPQGLDSGYIDQTGKIVVSLSQGSYGAGDFSEGLAPVGAGGTKLGYIDKTGQFIIKPRFDKAYSFSDGIARVQDDGKYGYIDRSGELVADLMFDDAGDFSDGVALVKIGSRTGYIDKRGRYIWKPSK